MSDGHSAMTAGCWWGITVTAAAPPPPSCRAGSHPAAMEGAPQADIPFAIDSLPDELLVRVFELAGKEEG